MRSSFSVRALHGPKDAAGIAIMTEGQDIDIMRRYRAQTK
jgi:hypothetical protein